MEQLKRFASNIGRMLSSKTQRNISLLHLPIELLSLLLTYLDLMSARKVCLILNLDYALAYRHYNFQWKSFWNLQYSCYRIKSITDSRLDFFRNLQLNSKFKKSFNSQQIFEFAVVMNDLDLVERLQDSVEPDFDCNLAVRLAAREGNLSILNLLLKDSRVDPSAINNYAIQHASMNGHLSIVESLLQDSRVDPGDDNNLALNIASQKGHEEIVELLLKSSKVNPMDLNNAALSYALKNNHISVAKMLLKDHRVRSLLDDRNFYCFSSRLEVLELKETLKSSIEEIKTKIERVAFEWAINNAELNSFNYIVNSEIKSSTDLVKQILFNFRGKKRFILKEIKEENIILKLKNQIQELILETVKVEDVDKGVIFFLEKFQ